MNRVAKPAFSIRAIQMSYSMFSLQALAAVVMYAGLATGTAHAAEFRSVASETATLYDTDSQQGARLYTIRRYTPVEVVIQLGGWVKIRDSAGDIAWIEGKDLTSQRTVVVTAAKASIHKEPDEKSPVAFQAERSVALERLGSPKPGWINVRHIDGEAGYIKISNIWGE